MTCVHLQQLYKLCQDQKLKLGSSDLIHVVCHQCSEQEVCPSTLMDEYDAKLSQSAFDAKQNQAEDSTS